MISMMKFGIWAPMPHVTVPEDRMNWEIEQLQSVGKKDTAFQYAIEVLQKAESYGFYNSLVAQRFLGMDLEAWVLASALSPKTENLELIVAVHPGIVNPQVVSKMSATLDRVSNGRTAINIVNGWWKEELNTY